MHRLALSFKSIQCRIAAHPYSQAPAMDISGTIITLHEEDHNEAVIRSLQRCCSEGIVVGSLGIDIRRFIMNGGAGAGGR